MLTEQEAEQFYGPDPISKPNPKKNMTTEEIQTIPTAALLEELEQRVNHIREAITPLPEDIITVIRSVCRHFGVTETQLFSQSRIQGIAWARMAALTIINAAGHSLTATAAVFRMDHSSVSHARERVQTLRQTDRVFRRRFVSALDEIEQAERNRPAPAHG